MVPGTVTGGAVRRGMPGNQAPATRPLGHGISALAATDDGDDHA